jgi:hypothetical protein
MEITRAAIYTLQLYYSTDQWPYHLWSRAWRILTTSGGVGLSSGARAKPPMMTEVLEHFDRRVAMDEVEGQPMLIPNLGYHGLLMQTCSSTPRTFARFSTVPGHWDRLPGCGFRADGS